MYLGHFIYSSTLRTVMPSVGLTITSVSYSACERLQIKLAGETVYDNSGESHLSVYKDLWRTKTDRLQTLEYGILDNHGLYAPFSMNNNFQYIITLPTASTIMTAQSGSAVGTSSLENLELEYETVQNPYIAMEVTQGYSTGRSLSYEHTTLMKTTEWGAASTSVNENINIPESQ